MIYIGKDDMQSWSRFKRDMVLLNITMSVDAIQVRLEQFKHKMKEDKKHKEIYATIIDYLERTLKIVQKNELHNIDNSWDYDAATKTLYSTGDELLNVKEMGLDCTDFMFELHESIMEINTMPVQDMVAAATCYRDLGKFPYEVDNELNEMGCGLASTIDSEKIYNIFGKNIYNELYPLRIDNNDSYFDKTMITFLGTERKMATDTYAEYLKYNTDQVMTNMIYKYIQDITNSEKKQVKFIGMMETSIYFKLYQLSTERVKEIFDQDIYIKAFGRNVKVKPLIRIS